jgi:hypothetical protein
MFNNFFLIVQSVRCGKILQNPTGHRRQYDSKATVCWIPKATNTHSQQKYLLLFHCNNGCKNAPQHYVIRTLPVLVTSWYDKKDVVILNKIQNIRRSKIWELNHKINAIVVVAFIPTEYHWVTSRLHVTEPYHPARPDMDAEVLTILEQNPTGRPYFTKLQILQILGTTFSYAGPSGRTV